MFRVLRMRRDAPSGAGIAQPGDRPGWKDAGVMPAFLRLCGDRAEHAGVIPEQCPRRWLGQIVFGAKHRRVQVTDGEVVEIEREPIELTEMYAMMRREEVTSRSSEQVLDGIHCPVIDRLQRRSIEQLNWLNAACLSKSIEAFEGSAWCVEEQQVWRGRHTYGAAQLPVKPSFARTAAQIHHKGLLSPRHREFRRGIRDAKIADDQDRTTLWKF